MGSPDAREEEERLIQMVTDFIELGSASYPSPSDPPPVPHKPSFSILQEILTTVADEETEVLGKVLIYLRDLELERATCNDVKKLIVQRLVMDGFEASLCRTSWVSAFPRPSAFEFTGDYEYVDVVMKSINGGEPSRLIVDVDFRSQFELARPTPTYSELSTSLPCVFVGTDEKLMKIISLLSSAAKQSLRERGLHIPPWRKQKYIQSKWLSDNCKKLFFSPTRGWYCETGRRKSYG
ncbi:hypothetical protein NMG60_11032895 [Bertholletia excelsa]